MLTACNQWMIRTSKNRLTPNRARRYQLGIRWMPWNLCNIICNPNKLSPIIVLIITHQIEFRCARWFHCVSSIPHKSAEKASSFCVSLQCSKITMQTELFQFIWPQWNWQCIHLFIGFYYMCGVVCAFSEWLVSGSRSVGASRSFFVRKKHGRQTGTATQCTSDRKATIQTANKHCESPEKGLKMAVWACV